MRRLSQTRRRILSHLARRNWERDGCPDAREIAQACGEHRRASDWAHGPLREMASHGLVERVGVSPANAATWRITPAGRAALDDRHQPVRVPTAAQAALLRLMGDKPDILCCDPTLRPAWWLNGGDGVRSQVASSVLAAGWVQQTSGPSPITTYTRTEAGRTALASTKGDDR